MRRAGRANDDKCRGIFQRTQNGRWNLFSRIGTGKLVDIAIVAVFFFHEMTGNAIGIIQTVFPGIRNENVVTKNKPFQRMDNTHAAGAAFAFCKLHQSGRFFCMAPVAETLHSPAMNSLFEASVLNWFLILLAAFIIGLSKAGIKGIDMMNVTIMAIVFGGKASTGVVLPLLCAVDIMAVIYY